MIFRKLYLCLCLLLLINYIDGQNIRSRRNVYQFYKKTKHYYQQSEISAQDYNKDTAIASTTMKYSSTPKTINYTLDEGSFCRRSADNRGGYCILSYKCLHIIREFRKHGTKIDICSYSQKIPVICCPLEEKDVSLKPIIKKRVSAIKCDEYNALHSYQKDHPYPRYKKVYNITKCEASIPLIVGGEVAYPAEFPYMAAVGWRKTQTEINWACGGSLISELFVLTAAHCTHMGGKQPEIIRLGEHNLRGTAPSSKQSQEIAIANIIVNPMYKTSLYYHDIALLKLEKNAIFTKFTRPACLWQKSNFNFQSGIATGWGRKNFLGRKSDELLKVDLKIIDQNLCKKLYMNERKLPNGILFDYQFCAGHLEGGKDTCQGDSGGPLQTRVIDAKCINYVVGITSFGKFCAAPNAPGVYTKVYAYIDWIENIVFKNNSTAK